MLTIFDLTLSPVGGVLMFHFIHSYLLYSWWLAVPAAIWTAVAVLIAFHWNFWKYALATMPRDVHGLYILFKVKSDLRRRMARNQTISQIFESEVLPVRAREVALVSVETGVEYTFQQVHDTANQVANYFHGRGLRQGDVVALYMNNCPEYVITWLGLSRLGVVMAWINYNLRQTSLMHCMNIAKVAAVITDQDLQSAISEIYSDGTCDKPVPTYVFGEVTDKTLGEMGACDYKAAIEDCSKELTHKSNIAFGDMLCYIYTSGTTGLPKAAFIKHLRYYFMCAGIAHCFNLTSNDRIYVTMPMYHSAAGILGVGQMLTKGCTLVIRKKFSASRFWDDCVKYQCTASQYIGEVCRYLLAQPFKESEARHSLRLVYGNGLRPDIWKQMVKRYKIAQIGEFYGSTEGNSNLVNTYNYPGAVGFLPLYTFLLPLMPVSLVKVDETTGEIIRDSNGLCIRCKGGETGQMVGRIIKNDALLDFQGYVSGKDTEKKVVKNVFKHGDVAFSSGDLLHMDKQGYLYFKDRTGDTFRWKGENVSTTEVETVLHRLLSLSDATVYGVEIPGTDGRAGMAAIVDGNDNTDLKSLNRGFKTNLPAYARPVFLRICAQVDTTGTYKLKKFDLQKDGYDLEKCKGDPVYYLNAKTQEYERLTSEVLQDIIGQKLRF